MLRLYLVRHGWTAWHTEGRIAGWADVPLDARGRAEALAAGQWLAGHCQARPAAVIASPVRRAQQTAEAIAAAFDPPLPLRIEEGIAETRVAEWQGALARDIAANDPRWPEFYQGPADFLYPGGETGRTVQARAVALVEALKEQHPEGELILVSHAEPLRGIVAHYLGMEANHYYRLRIDCGSISRLSLRGHDPSRPSPPARLDSLNSTDHLRSLTHPESTET
jgi:broad specificity phosphatase PhoE